MIKTIGLLRAKPGISREEFARHWRDVHGPLSLGVPGIRRYVQNHITQERPTQQNLRPIEAQIDGIVEMWYDNWDDYERSRNSPEVKAKLNTAGQDVETGTPEEMGAFLEAEIKKWARVIKEAGIKVEDD